MDLSSGRKSRVVHNLSRVCSLVCSSSFDGLRQDEKIIVELGVLAAQVVDSTAGMQDGGMVAAAQGVTTFGKAADQGLVACGKL